MKVMFLSFGCKVNSVETASIREAFLEAGHTECGPGEEPELCIVNTCSVTSTAEAKLRRKVRSIARAHPGVRFVLMGCYATRDPAALLELPRVEAVLSNKRKKMVLRRYLGEAPSSEWFPVRSSGRRSRAFVKVQEDCQEGCSYGRVSRLRGAPRSRPTEEAVEEICALAEAGVPEVVLTGVNLAAWGTERGSGFHELLGALAEAAPPTRIRISSVELRYLDDRLLEAMASAPALFCRHLHVPLQSGSDRLLEAMNRRYTAAEFLARIRRAREMLGPVGLTTDVIVGFPGEGEDDFRRTLEVCAEAGFHRIHAFSFSPREGTPAADLGGAVGGEVKRERIARLAELARANLEEFVSSELKGPLEVVFEGEEEPAPEREGYSSEYLRVRSGTVPVPGSRLVRVRSWSLEGSGLVVRPPLEGPAYHS